MGPGEVVKPSPADNPGMEPEVGGGWPTVTDSSWGAYWDSERTEVDWRGGTADARASELRMQLEKSTQACAFSWKQVAAERGASKSAKQLSSARNVSTGSPGEMSSPSVRAVTRAYSERCTSSAMVAVDMLERAL